MSHARPIIFCSKDTDQLKTVGQKAKCEKCGEGIWVSQSSHKGIREAFPDVDFDKTPIMYLCIDCGLQMAVNVKREGGNFELKLPTKEQLDELKNLHKNN